MYSDDELVYSQGITNWSQWKQT